VAVTTTTPGIHDPRQDRRSSPYRHRRGRKGGLQVFKGEYNEWNQLCDRAQKQKQKYFGDNFATRVGGGGVRRLREGGAHTNTHRFSVQPREEYTDDNDDEHEDFDDEAVEALEDGAPAVVRKRLAIRRPPYEPRPGRAGKGGTRSAIMPPREAVAVGELDVSEVQDGGADETNDDVVIVNVPSLECPLIPRFVNGMDSGFSMFSPPPTAAGRRESSDACRISD
jgi:hypothetical protein